MDADSRKAEDATDVSAASAGEERMFDEQGDPVGPDAVTGEAQGGADDAPVGPSRALPWR